MKEVVTSVVYCPGGKGAYSTQSRYAVINFRGVMPVYEKTQPEGV